MPSGFHLFQVGGISLPFPKNELTNSYSNQSKGKNTDFYAAMNPLVRDTQFLQKERKLKYKGLAFDLKNYNFEWADNYLRGIVGKPVPMIAYIIHGNEAEKYGCSCSCNRGKDCCGLTFIQALGIVTEVDGISEKDWASPREFSFGIELVSPWRGIDRLRWSYHNSGLNSQVTAIEVDYDLAKETRLPSCAEFFKDCKECNSVFSPIVFKDDCKNIYDLEALRARLQLGCCENDNCCVGKVGSIIEYGLRGVSYDVDVEPNYWNAPPLSVYTLHGARGGSPIITTRGTDSRLMPIIRRTVVDIPTTNEILVANNLAAINENDLIVFGDFSYYNGTNLLNKAMIIRDEVALDIQPVITYPDYFPAMVHPAQDAKVSAIGDFDTISMAHYFRRF